MKERPKYKSRDLRGLFNHEITRNKLINKGFLFALLSTALIFMRLRYRAKVMNAHVNYVVMGGDDIINKLIAINLIENNMSFIIINDKKRNTYMKSLAKDVQNGRLGFMPKDAIPIIERKTGKTVNTHPDEDLYETTDNVLDQVIQESLQDYTGICAITDSINISRPVTGRHGEVRFAVNFDDHRDSAKGSISPIPKLKNKERKTLEDVAKDDTNQYLTSIIGDNLILTSSRNTKYDDDCDRLITIGESKSKFSVEVPTHRDRLRDIIEASFFDRFFMK